MFQSITLFDFKLERLSTGAWNWILERIQWKELSFAFDHQLYCVASFCVLIERKYHVHHLERYLRLTLVIGRQCKVWGMRVIYFLIVPMDQNPNKKFESFSLEIISKEPHWHCEVVKYPDVSCPAQVWRCPKVKVWKYQCWARGSISTTRAGIITTQNYSGNSTRLDQWKLQVI